MSVSRTRKRPWPEQQIESDMISALTRGDKKKATSSIPCNHSARHGWEFDKDACSYKMRAIHTDVEGQSSDPKILKANFCRVMNCLPDIEEVKDKSINKGHPDIRILSVLPSTSKMKQDVEDSSDSESESSLEEFVKEDPLTPPSSTDDRRVNMETPVKVQSEGFLHDIASRFESSPDYNSESDSFDETIRICQMLESESTWTLPDSSWL